MPPQFIRVLRQRDDKEILLSVGSIWKIEVTYATRGPDGRLFSLPLADGLKSPDAVRLYKVFAGSEVVSVPAKPGDPVMAVIEGLYLDAVKATPKPPAEGE